MRRKRRTCGNRLMMMRKRCKKVHENLYVPWFKLFFFFIAHGYIGNMGLHIAIV